ncbi:MAG: adenosylcobalamin-dependent ribonucleoside-diphosphate reductase [gamma proteobacterium symbiont of Clathrolucina costata]
MKDLPLQIVSEEVILEKYAKGKEKTLSGHQIPDGIRKRVAAALAAPEKDSASWEAKFYEAQVAGVIMAGRINSAAGTELSATLLNCFVQGVGDATSGYDNGRPGIYVALNQAAETMRRGGGVGYDFSHIRPRGAKVNSTGSSASGPVSYMHVYDRSCQTVESAGARRGAQMGLLRVDHPDIREFIMEKRKKGSLTQFNVSVAVTDAFMLALERGEKFQLVHKAKPSDTMLEQGAYQRDDGQWVYESSVDPQELWGMIMDNTFTQAEPGVVFIDRVNAENNLYYIERIEACNPCGEQFLPDYGCCCLGSLNLAAFVRHPFSGDQCFDWDSFKQAIRTAVRMLDNVLDITYWPLEEQAKEAASKRRVGLGITGLGSMLVMLNLRYDSQEGRDMAERISVVLRDEAYRASIELAKEKGAFPLFDHEKYLASRFVQRLPEDIREGIAEYGIRNSHLLSIAPTGTISLAFADNASNGIEPAFSWTYHRNKRMADGSTKQYQVMDHAYRVYVENGGDPDSLPDCFVNALETSPEDHLAMVAVFAKNIDSAISKTINCPEDISFDDFKDIYLKAYQLGLKGITTFRPNNVTGAVLEVTPSKPADLDTSADRKIRLEKIPKPALASLRWPSRPECADGNPSITYLVKHPVTPFAVFVGHIENGTSHPFEVWVNGEEQPRGLGALAKSISMDMRSEDKGWLKAKLDALAKTAGQPFEMQMPGGEMSVVASEVSALARLVSHRCHSLGIFNEIKDTPLLDAMFSKKEPKSGVNGTLSWTVDVYNPSTGDDFALFLKELVLPDGSHRPYSMWVSGDHPDMAGLCKSLSLDMRVIDPAWIGKKLRSLKAFPEPQGDFMAKIPDSDKMETQPSTVAYVARLILHRYQMLGILDKDGYPVSDMGIFDQSTGTEVVTSSLSIMAGRKCPECGVKALIKKDSCDFCTACGHIGSCG